MNYELENSILFKISHTANSLNSVFNNILQPFNLAVEQRITLEYIKRQKKVNQTKIANVLAKDKTTISRTIRALESKGFIKKDKRTIDGRTNLISLTSLGEEVLEKSKFTVEAFRQKLALKLSKDEQKILDVTLSKLLMSIEEEK